LGYTPEDIHYYPNVTLPDLIGTRLPRFAASPAFSRTASASWAFSATDCFWSIAEQPHGITTDRMGGRHGPSCLRPGQGCFGVTRVYIPPWKLTRVPYSNQAVSRS